MQSGLLEGCRKGLIMLYVQELWKWCDVLVGGSDRASNKNKTGMSYLPDPGLLSWCCIVNQGIYYIRSSLLLHTFLLRLKGI